ncbi:PepSY-associated TM helix domain-containing protein [Myroides odoratimimus]|uniref:PepSY-associated TM helix domain-containing protein n=1 Tax=Myroides odoratimimus TaxID=76832 RepID=UPI00257769B3|nr:PepSY-associated TM helix domain-containing protein [Myroides odoratimimus]
MKKKGKSTFSKIIAWLHLWPSIVAGIILVFVSLTGTIIVYGDEIMQWSAGKEARYIKPNGVPLKIDEITALHKEKFPGHSFSYIVVDKDPSKSWVINSVDLKDRKLSFIYINPYTGEILKQDHSISFFYVIAQLHSNLLMGKTGGWIVAISTIIFVLSTLTGLVLWWPKKWTKATRDSSFKIKWKAKFKRP